MNRRVTLRASIVLGCAIALVTAGSALGQGKKVGSGDILADRQRLMRLNNDSWKDMVDKAKAGNIEAIAVNAETIALNAMHIPVLFPEGSGSEKSRAKPEIWQKWAEFEKAAQNLQAQAEKLRDTAKSKNADATQALVKDFSKTTCDICHTPFRAPRRT